MWTKPEPAQVQLGPNPRTDLPSSAEQALILIGADLEACQPLEGLNQRVVAFAP
jgi:hypothetical protein